MSDVDRLLSEYIAEHRAGGEADPVGFLDQLEGADREELATLLDAYLQRTPAQEWDADAFHGSAAERLTQSLHRSLGGRAGLWPVVLPRLRERAKVKRAELVERLADSLGVADRGEKVAAYYHDMEQGSLEASGVSDRVLGALVGIVGGSVESLRKAGESLAESAPGEGQASPAFTRIASSAADRDEMRSEDAARSTEDDDWDEVDEIFRGSA